MLLSDLPFRSMVTDVVIRIVNIQPSRRQIGSDRLNVNFKSEASFSTRCW